MEGCMDHDDKIMSVRENKVQLFLRENLLSIRQEQQKGYDLDVEFAKTGKNKDYLVVWIIVAVVAVVALGAWLVTSSINKSSRNIAVDIKVFEDINLRNVLDLAQKAEDSYNSIQQERQTAEADYQSNFDTLEVQRKSELDILSAKKLSDSERTAQKQSINATYTKRESALKAANNAALAAIDKRLEDAKKQMESFDKKRVDEARAQKQLMDNQQDLFALEKKKMQDDYEKQIADLRTHAAMIEKENSKLKTDQVKELIDEYQARIAALDPVFADENATGLLDRIALYKTPDAPFQTAPSLIPSDFGYSADDFATVAQGYTGISALLSKVAAIPWENNTGTYVNGALKIALLTGSVGESMIHTAFARIDLDRKNLAAEQAKRAEVEDALAASQKETEDAKAALDASQADLQTAQAALDNAAKNIAAFNTTLTDSARTNGFEGIVVDVSDPAAPSVLLVSEVLDTLALQQTAVVYVYQAPKTLLGTLLLTRTDTGVTAAVDVIEKKKELLPLSFISMKKK